MNTSIILLFLGLGSLCLVGVLGQTDSVVFNIRIDIPDCNNCGMTDLGQISVKLCGGGGCCFKGEMGSRYSDGGQYIFDGIQIGECDGFDLGEVTEDNLWVGLYHSGTDALNVEFVGFQYLSNNGAEFHYAECDFEGQRLDDMAWILSNQTLCYIM